MGPLFLRLIFYMVTGVLLASISWSTISHSAVTGDYLLSFILLGMMFYVVGQFFVDRLRPEVAPHDFHDTRLWKTPHKDNDGGIVASCRLQHVAEYSDLHRAGVRAHPADNRPAGLHGTARNSIRDSDTSSILEYARTVR